MARNNYGFLLSNLVLRDFKIRYRNMSLGIFWSLLNPLVLMGVLTFLFTKIYPSSIPNYHVFVLCGLVVYSFFSLGWASGTISIYGNVTLIKRVPMPRELLPVSTVLGNCIHFLIQIALLILLTLSVGASLSSRLLWTCISGTSGT
jgi:ABC-type polysaccharide/polyol phosphate export permease